LLNAIKAVQIVSASLQRKPELYRTQSFYGKLDFWRYVPEFDKKLCDRCRGYWETYFFRGTELRSTFPYHKIKDEDTIDVEVHPNCRCFLYRVTIPSQYEKVYKRFYGD
jgi:hypothetical protein